MAQAMLIPDPICQAVLDLIACEIRGAALDRHVPGSRENAGNGQQLRQMLGVEPIVELLVVLGVDVDVDEENTSALLGHVLSRLLQKATIALESSAVTASDNCRPASSRPDHDCRQCHVGEDPVGLDLTAPHQAQPVRAVVADGVVHGP